MIKISPSTIADIKSKIYTNRISLIQTAQVVGSSINVSGLNLRPHLPSHFTPDMLCGESKSIGLAVHNGLIRASLHDKVYAPHLFEYGIKYTGSIRRTNKLFVSALSMGNDIRWQTLEDVPDSVLHNLVHLHRLNRVEIYLRESAKWFTQLEVFYNLGLPIVSPLQPVEPPKPTPVLYDTIVGVGDSITDGEIRLSKMFYHNNAPLPFRGTTFDTGSVPGTTLSYIVDNVANFTGKAKGKTLFVVRAGINDCNTFLSANGVSDGSSGEVTSWNDLSSSQKAATTSLYRTLVALLRPFGDVALATLTYCDAKGKLLPMPDKGRLLHSGSWNDNCVVPLCKELTPDFFDDIAGRPIFDYYTETYNKPESLDVDNLHFYNDSDYKGVDVGYPNGGGSFVLRNYLINTLERIGNLRPYLTEPHTDRVLVNLCSTLALTNRPLTNRKNNNVVITTATGNAPLVSLKGATGGQISWVASHAPTLKNNLSTTSFKPSEGLLDPNALSSGAFIQAGRTLTFELRLPTNARGKPAVIKLAGLFWTDRDSTAWVTRVNVGHSLPRVVQNVSYSNVVNNTANLNPVEGVHTASLNIQVPSDGSPITLEVVIAGTEQNAGISSIEVLY